MEVSINSSHLKAAYIFTATHDIRYYLHGVLVEISSTETRLAATDGSCAVVLRDQVTSGVQDVMPEIIIPNDTIKLALSTKKVSLPLSMSVDGKWSLGGIGFEPIFAKFPDYRRVMVSEVSGDAGDFDLELLSRFSKAAKALGVKSTPIVRQNGSNGAQVQVLGREDEFVGVIMPMRMFTATRPDPGISLWGNERK